MCRVRIYFVLFLRHVPHACVMQKFILFFFCFFFCRFCRRWANLAKTTRSRSTTSSRSACLRGSLTRPRRLSRGWCTRASEGGGSDSTTTPSTPSPRCLRFLVVFSLGLAFSFSLSRDCGMHPLCLVRSPHVVAYRLLACLVPDASLCVGALAHGFIQLAGLFGYGKRLGGIMLVPRVHCKLKTCRVVKAKRRQPYRFRDFSLVLCVSRGMMVAGSSRVRRHRGCCLATANVRKSMRMRMPIWMRNHCVREAMV